MSSNQRELEERSQVRENEKQWVPQIITGGKEPDDPSNWLINLPLGTVFLTKSQKEPIVLGLWQIVYKKGKAVRLANPENYEEKLFVDSDAFCKVNYRFEILPSAKDE